MPDLTNQRHEAVAEALASGLDHAAIAERTGYTAAGVNRLAARPDIRARVRELRGGTEVNRAWVVTQLRAVFERAMQEPLAKGRGKGRATGSSGRESVALKALELLGRELGMFRAKRGVEPSDVLRLSDAEMEALITALGGTQSDTAPPEEE